MSWSRRLGERRSGAGASGSALAEAQVEGRNDEQVQQRRGDEAAHDDDRERVLELVPRDVARERERQEGEPGGERRHEDRREPLPCARKDKRRPEDLALLALEVLEVVDHEDAVARGDPEHGVEPDERAEREDPAGEPRRQCAADERHRKREERERRQAPAPEGRLQEEEDRDRSADPVEKELPLRLLPLLELAEHGRVVAE